MDLPGMTMYISGFSDSSLYANEIASEETIGVTNLRNSGYWLATKELIYVSATVAVPGNSQRRIECDCAFRFPRRFPKSSHRINVCG